MTDKHIDNQPETQLSTMTSQPLIAVPQSAHYLTAKSSWQRRWQAVIEQCSDCFIRF